MTLVEFLILLLIAGICGGIAQSLVGYSHVGCLGSIALGLIGALLGAWIARMLGVGDVLAVSIGDHTYPVIWSVIGATLFVAVLNLFRPRPVV